MSMRDAGILDGDWLAVHRQPQARSDRSSSLVWATRSQLRLKLRGSCQLIAENEDYKPIVVDLKREPLQSRGLRSA